MNSIVLLAALVTTPVQYQFKTDHSVNYTMSVAFDGFIPILGGQDGKAEARLKVLVKGAESKTLENLIASSELTDAELFFNEAKLPLGLDNIKDFFPKTTIKLTPFGKIIETDAPDKNLPIKLPGLDAKRFPDISYLPIEFPAEGVEIGKPFKFTKNFGDSPVEYECTMQLPIDDIAKFELTIKQSYSVMENISLEIVKAKEDAEFMVDTVVAGKGYVLFDMKKSQVKKMALNAVATSNVVEIATKTKSNRKLTTTLKVDRIEK